MSKRSKARVIARAETKDTRPKAFARHIRISPYKVRSILDLVRGKALHEAIAILQTVPSSASPVILKVVQSAAANAENQNISRHNLVVAEIFADQGPSLKRVMPKGKGSADRILKRTSHITVILDTPKEDK
ncbi:MAG: 50S ribosomal protein L22 [Clostridiales bacterium]|jgi:large subunit ribosomal protein L22|nr:50S ribosomal protein L22 [Clostridiales bacterium]